MAEDRGGGVRWWLRLLLDPQSKKRVQAEAQEALDKGTDPKKAKQNVREVESSLDRLVGIARKVGAVLGSIWVVRKVAEYGKAVFDLGARVNAVRSQFNTVFGDIAKGLDRSLRGWRQMAGITGTEMREILASLGSMAQGLGMTVDRSADFSTIVLKLAGDLASFSGGAYSTAEAAQILQSAIIGNTEAARALKVNFTAADVQQRAMEMTGKRTAAALTQEEKALAAVAVITQRAGPQVGDLARTQHEADNRAKQLSATWREMKELLAASLLPVFDALFRKLDEIDAMDRLREAAETVADSMDDIVAGVVALTKALVVGGAIVAVTRLTRAIRAAKLATDAWKASTAGAQALMGPKGWFVLGVGLLTELFYAQGAAAREAAAGVRDYLDSLGSMSREELLGQAEALRAQRDEILATIERLEADGTTGSRQTANKLRENLQTILAAGREVGRLLVEMDAPETPSDPKTPDPEEAEKALKERIKLLGEARDLGILTSAEAEELLQLQRDTANALMDANLSLERRVQLVERLRRLGEITGGLEVRPTVDLAGDDLPTDFSAPGSVTALLSDEEVSWLESNWEAVGQAGMNAAYGVSGAWQDAFSLLFEEGASLGDFFDELGAGMAGAMLGGVAQLASVKVAENIAWAIEKTGQALGFSALGLVPQGATSSASAAHHWAAAAAWSALAGAAGAGQSSIAGGSRGGLSGGVPTGARDIGGRIADQQITVPEVHVWVDNIDPNNPTHAKVIYGASEKGKALAGPNARVIVHPRTGSGG